MTFRIQLSKSHEDFMSACPNLLDPSRDLGHHFLFISVHPKRKEIDGQEAYMNYSITFTEISFSPATSVSCVTNNYEQFI